MASTLLLVPTQMEWDCFSKDFRDRIPTAHIRVEVCGFGPIVSAIRTTQLIARYKPDQVLLAGIAGALGPACLVGSAVEFDEAVCYGIGAGSGGGFLSAAELGWSQWPEAPEISDVVRWHSDSDNQATPRTLLTCCAASADSQDVAMRIDKYANAIAEDMEGFSVAAACRLAGIAIRVVRGISNLAGDRNKSHWRVHEAMAAVEKRILEILEEVTQ